MISSRLSSAEPRLLRFNLSDFQDPTVYNSRTAAANAAQQSSQRQAQVAANQALITQNPNGLDPKASNLAAPVAPVASNTQLYNAQQTYANNDAGFQSSIQQRAGGGQVYQSPVQIAASGGLDQSAIDNLRKQGLDDNQIRSILTDPARTAEIKQTMSNTGLGGTARQSAVNLPNSATTPQERANNAANDVVKRLQDSGVMDPAVLNKARQDAIQQELATQTAQSNADIASQQKMKTDALSSAASSEAASKTKPPVQTPQQIGADSGLMLAIQNLGPEYSFLGNVVQEALNRNSQNVNDAAGAYGSSVDAAGKNFNAQESILSQIQKGYKDSKDQSQALIEQIKTDSQKALADQQKAEEERNAFMEMQATRKLEDEKRKAVDSEIAGLAISGGFGSSNGNHHIEETKAQYETALSDLHQNAQINRTEIAAKYSAMYVDANNKYLTDSLNNIKTYTDALAKVAEQDMSLTNAKYTAEQTALEKFMSSVQDSRKQLGTEISKITTDIGNTINQQRDDKRAQEQLGWQRLQWTAQTYGSNAPQALLDSIGKQLPGVDVRSVASQMTLAEMKKKGGGSSLSFPPSMMKAGGQIPSYEDFVNAKKAELKANKTLSIEEAKAALNPAKLRAEYEARKTATTQYNPTEIVNRFKMKAGTLDAPKRKYAEATLNDYLANGQYELAAQLVDNTGDDVPSTESVNFENALGARNQLISLHMAMKDVGRIGPVTGKLKRLNPYDPAVKRVQQMITETVPNLARGTFHEVGVLTDSDVERYTGILENPDLTVQQAQQTYEDLMHTIDVNMQNKISVWDANGKRTGGYKTIYNSLPQAPNDNSEYEQKKSDFLNSLP